MSEIFERIMFVEGLPLPWPKKVIQTKGKGGKPLPFPIVRRRSPKTKEKKFENWERAVIAQAEVDFIGWTPREDKTVPIEMGTIFIIPRPKSISYKKRQYPTVAPDYDNYDYAITNLLKGFAYVDDNQVVSRLPGGVFYAEDYQNLKYVKDALTGKLTAGVPWRVESDSVDKSQSPVVGSIGAVIYVSAINVRPRAKICQIMKYWDGMRLLT